MVGVWRVAGEWVGSGWCADGGEMGDLRFGYGWRMGGDWGGDGGPMVGGWGRAGFDGRKCGFWLALGRPPGIVAMVL